jgi:hypothetical protein
LRANEDQQTKIQIKALESGAFKPAKELNTILKIGVPTLAG